MEILALWLPLVITLSFGTAVITAVRWILFRRAQELTSEQRLPRQMVVFVIILVLLIAVSLTLPVSESSRNQLLALIGVLVSGVIAFSSTTIVANLMSGLVIRFNKPFKTGDFIRCNDYFGRVSEKGLLDTEIQTEQRDLIHIANSYLVNNPVSVIRSSGTLITANISIGYDVHHTNVTEALNKAVLEAGLEEGYVQVSELGDFSVSYRVAGLLKEVKSVLTARSNLHKAILDTLHNSDIEIMSPNFIAQRPTEATQKFIAKMPTNVPGKTNASVEDDDAQEAIAFDKAELAAQHEESLRDAKAKVESVRQQISEAKGSDKTALEKELEGALNQVDNIIKLEQQTKETE
ncbi:mechanosensitive ion channel family protein [Alteromonas sp. P256]|uniref:mechanosensitive ion channel family protein n=1 Tax=Alteromonas sp. P256 TaxID=3117399 RepID=UPI002FE3514D